MMDGEKHGRIGVAILAGGGDDEDASPADMACKGMWTAIKDDDYEGFKDSLAEYVKHAGKSEKTEELSSDDY